MIEFYEWGLTFIDMFATLESWLLYQPFSAADFQAGWDLLGWSDSLLSSIEGLSIGELIVGGGITFILGFKLVKFFTDLVL